jgi:hypothetical protein
MFGETFALFSFFCDVTGSKGKRYGNIFPVFEKENLEIVRHRTTINYNFIKCIINKYEGDPKLRILIDIV